MKVVFKNNPVLGIENSLLKSVSLLCLSSIIIPATVFARNPDVAVVYFSLPENATAFSSVDGLTSASLISEKGPGTTASVAEAIESALEKMYQMDVPKMSISVRDKYEGNFDTVVARNHAEAASDAEPDLVNSSEFNAVVTAKTVFIGYPTWNMNIPRAVASFMKSVDWRGKRIAVFNTNDGYGAGRGVQSILSLAQGAQQLGNVYSIQSDQAVGSISQVQKWIAELGLSQNNATDTFTENEISGRVAGHSFRIKLNNSPEARQFVKMLPLRVRMSGYGGREYYGGIDGNITTTGEGQYHFTDGMFTYCPTNNTVAVFYAQTNRPNLSMSVYPIGQVQGDLQIFHNLGSSEVFEFSDTEN